MILASTCMLPALTLGYILAALVLLLAYLDSSIAGDILRIETILTSPISYAQHHVDPVVRPTLTGVKGRVTDTPALDEDLGFVQRMEEPPVQQLIPQLP